MHRVRPDTTAATLAWLTLTVVICYANALTGDFQFDDYNVIVNNAQVHSWESWFANLGSGIRPLLKFSYTLNWTTGGSPVSFHLTNLLIHLGNTFLVYRLSQLFVQQQWQQDKLRHIPLLAALLFAAHPIHTEAVSYICGRSASLMTLFYLAALWCYIMGRINHNKTCLYLATPLLFVLALGVKETAITFPLALLAWERYCGGKWQYSFKPQWPSWLILLAGVLFFLFNDSYSAQMQRSAELNSLGGNLATQFSALAYLLRQWAVPLWLNIDPDLPLHRDFSAGPLPALFFAMLVAGLLLCRNRRPWISFALAWVILQLVPLYLFLPRLDIANERQMYLAGWPLLPAMLIELTLLLEMRAMRLAAIALLLTFAGLTVLRNQAYRNEISLWENTALQSPRKTRVHNNLGYAYLLAQRHADARREFITALQLDPANYQARYNLRRLNRETGITEAQDAPLAPPH